MKRLVLSGFLAFTSTKVVSPLRQTTTTSITATATTARVRAQARLFTTTSSTCRTFSWCSSMSMSPNNKMGKAFAATTGSTSTRVSSTRRFSSSGNAFKDHQRTDDEQQQQEQQQQQQQLMQDILYRVREVNRMPNHIRAELLDFRVDGLCLGKLVPSNAHLLCSKHVLLDHNNDNDDENTNKITPVFRIVQEEEEDHDDASTTTTTRKKKKYVTFTENVGNTFESRSRAVALVAEALRDDNIIRGWRNELYPVSTSFYDPPVFVMERAAVAWLGVLEYGVHINGLVVVPTNDNNNDDNDNNNKNAVVKMWMARRSKTKPKYPGLLDHIVAGGQPAGMSLMDNVIKECLEEAGISEDVARAGIRPAGAISYETYNGPRTNTISRAVLFAYDLYLPSDFTPQPVDGEVEEFFLWTVDDILASMAPNFPDPIKPNCYAVIIDYLVRQGHLSPDVPGYLDVLRELRSGSCC